MLKIVGATWRSCLHCIINYYAKIMPQKYFFTYKPAQRISGFIDNIGKLRANILRAYFSGRVLILLPAFLEIRHNAFIPGRKQIYDYLDLDDTRLFIDGKQKPFSYIWFEDLDKKDMDNWAVQASYAPGVENIEHLDDSTAELLIFFHPKYAKRWPPHAHHAPKLNKAPIPLRSPGEVSEKPKHKKKVFFSACQEYRRLSEQVIAALGGARNYYALHVRRRDRAILSPELNRATQAKAIIKRIQTMVSQGETLFLLSDEKAPHYFKPLEKHWKIVRYHDFPELARLVNHPNPFLHDNNALFLVEGLIYWQAKLKISSYQGHGIGSFGHFFKGQDTKDQRYLLDKTRLELFSVQKY